MSGEHEERGAPGVRAADRFARDVLFQLDMIHVAARSRMPESFDYIIEHCMIIKACIQSLVDTSKEQSEEAV